MEVMLSLGDYQFGLNTAAFQELNRSTDFRWPSQDVFEGEPALQFTGPGKDTITLPGVIFPEYWGGTGQLDTLRALGAEGRPMELVDGRGNVMGLWVITNVQERQSTFAGAGTPLRQEFTIALERYSSRGQTAFAVGGFAGQQIARENRAAAAVVIIPAGNIIANAGAQGSGALVSLTTAAASINALVGSVATPLNTAIAAVNQAMGVARSMQTTATVAQQTLKRLGSIKSLDDAQAVLNGLVLTTGSAAQATTRASRAVQDVVDTMTAAGEAAGAIRTVRAGMIEVNKLAVGATRLRGQAEDFVRSFQ